MTIKLLDLFSGIGGFSLAAHWLGWETVAFCEKDEHCRRVLKKHWPGVEIYDDIKTLKGSEILEKHGPIELICGGFPCQPWSVAGEQRGETDDRHLWPEMARIISEVRPAWVVAENVTGIIKLGLDGVLSDLEAQGYACQSFIIPAAAIGAPHRRDRVWIIAYSQSERPRSGRLPQRTGARNSPALDGRDATAYPFGTRQEFAGPELESPELAPGCTDVANANSYGQPQSPGAIIQERRRAGHSSKATAYTSGQRSELSAIGRHSTIELSGGDGQKGIAGYSDSTRRQEFNASGEPGREELSAWLSNPGGAFWQATEPGVYRVDDGIPPRMDGGLAYPVSPVIPVEERPKNYQARLRALGNAIMPELAFRIFCAIEVASND